MSLKHTRTAEEYVLVPGTITRIGVRAFAECERLSISEFQNPDAEIEETAFQYGSQLTIAAPAGGTVEEFAVRNEIPFAAKPMETGDNTAE